MIELQGTVTYADGSVSTFDTGPWVVSAWERYAVRNGLPTDPAEAAATSNLYIAYAAVHADVWPACEVGFEKWQTSVRGIEMDEAPARPTNPEASGT